MRSIWRGFPFLATGRTPRKNPRRQNDGWPGSFAIIIHIHRYTYMEHSGTPEVMQLISKTNLEIDYTEKEIVMLNGSITSTMKRVTVCKKRLAELQNVKTELENRL